MDLVIINPDKKVLFGKRTNSPAKDYWFVPGGRVYKNESLEQAFQRISQDELDIHLERRNSTFLGIYDHFYDDSVFGSNISTHYINAAHALYADLNISDLPKSQHQTYRWIGLDEIQQCSYIHQYSKIFLPELILTFNT